MAETTERELAIELHAFATVRAEVAETLKFHNLAGYRYALASNVSPPSTRSVQC